MDLNLKIVQLIAGGLLMGGATCFVYIFAALAPFLSNQYITHE